MNHLVLAVAALELGCRGGAATAPPARPSTGAPVAFEALGLAPGPDHTGTVEVRAYNFADQPVVEYSVMLRYRGKDSQILQVRTGLQHGDGTPFETSFDLASFAGPDVRCEPRSWCRFRIDELSIPQDAISAEIVAKTLRAAGDDRGGGGELLYDSPALTWPE